MHTPVLLHHLVTLKAQHSPHAPALSSGEHTVSYAELQRRIDAFASTLVRWGIRRNDRVAIYLDKSIDCVSALFGASAAGAIFVPVNPLLKPEQIAHILRDCSVRALVSSPERLKLLQGVLPECPALQLVCSTGEASIPVPHVAWLTFPPPDAATTPPPSPSIGNDLAAILYTSGSTGRPKGVMLSHHNLIAGAQSVASYLGNHPQDSLLAALPLSFDAGLSQLTTAFHAGARVVLLNYLLPRDVLKAMAREKITGLTAVPPLWIQLAQLEWPAEASQHLRYFANTGGHMPRATLDALRQRAPAARPFLMYGLTEAFRASYLPPEEVDRRPDSIGKAIPNAELLVLREDGSPCEANEPGELVQRGALVAQGYWNDPERTAERFRPLPATTGLLPAGLTRQEIAVFSGDTVRRDTEGFLYFVGRRDEMIKTSGYRVSPTEVEEALYASGLVKEAAAIGLPDNEKGQVIGVAIHPAFPEDFDQPALLRHCRAHLPAYMVPAQVLVVAGPLPRNPNGKIDRLSLCQRLQEMAS